MAEEWTERNVLPCGCVEKLRRDVSDKVIAQDMNHCIAHAIEWAGKFLVQAGGRLLSDLEKTKAADRPKMTAVYKDAEGRRLWAEDPYLHAGILVDGQPIVREGKGYKVVSGRQDGQVLTFVVEQIGATEPE